MNIVYFSYTNLGADEAGRKELGKREERLQSLVSKEVEIRIMDNPDGPQCIESSADEIKAFPGIARNLRAVQARGIDAGVLGCVVDPDFHKLRGMVTFPLIGPGHASIYMAAMIGNRFSVFTPLDSTIPMTRRLIEETGLIAQLGSIRPIDIPVLNIRANPNETFDKLVTLGQLMVEEDEADLLILGCGSLAFQDISGKLSKCLGVPVIDPVAVSVTLAESLARIGLSHSAQLVRPPEP